MSKSKKKKNNVKKNPSNNVNKAAVTEAVENTAKPVRKTYSDGSQKKMWIRVVMLIMAIVMILSFVMLPVMNQAYAEGAEGDVTVTEFKTGDLSSALTKAMDGVDQNNIKRVSVSGGTMNASDYSALCNLPNLEYIELAGCETENGIIPENALPARNQLTYLSLPSNTQKIGNSAFNNNKKLVKISMPSSVTEIGDYAFDSCIALTDITVPAGVTYIGEGAFRDCQSLAEFTLPAGVTEIPAYCFSKCVFTEFYIGPQVTSIGDGAFADCHELKDVYIYGDNAPELKGGSVFQNLNVTIHTADDAEGYDSWGSNFVSTAEGFNEEYIAPETAAPAVSETEEITSEETAAENDEINAETSAETENADEPAEETEAVSASENSSSSGVGTGAVIVIAVLAAALAVCITLLVVRSKK